MQIGFKNLRNNINSSKDLYAMDPTQRAWIEVSGKAIENNVRQIKSLLKSKCKFMAVVKADGYGHDAIFVSKNAVKGGADQLGVATLREGIELRINNIEVPILILGNIYTQNDLIVCFKNDLIPTISSMRELLICNYIGKKFHKKFIVHLKVDTGMSRLGFEMNNFIDNFEKFISFDKIYIDGIYSHLASADEDNSYDSNSFTQSQKRKFEFLLRKIQIHKYPKINVHLANSAATLLGQEFHFDMVRVGLSMYGYNPLTEIKQNLQLKSALCLKSKISFIRNIDKGTGVSYGRSFSSRRKTKLAVISIGYADGLCRKLSNQIVLLHQGNSYPQIGTITMDQLMIDITDSENIKVGDTVILLGDDQGESISPLDWALKTSTIPWEILCAFKNRLPRVQIL